MKRTSKKSWNLQKKLAVAMSLVNALNTTAPVALPYVNITKDLSAQGGKVQSIAQGHNSLFYGTAQAAGPTDSTTVAPGSTETRDTVSDGGKQVVEGGQAEGSAGGTGIITNMEGGTQIVNGGINSGSGGTGIITSMNSGWQDISGGSGIITSMSDGEQLVGSGTGTVFIMDNGGQYVNSGGNGTITTMNGGTQSINKDGIGTVETMASGGIQDISNHGVGTVTSLGGTQVVHKGGTSRDTHDKGGLLELRSGAVLQNSGGTAMAYN